MHTPQTVIRAEPPYSLFYPEAHFLNYGLGWFLSDYRGRKLVEHGGAIDGMRAQVAMIPEEKLGLVILTNLHGTALPVALMYRTLDAFLGAPQRDWSAEAAEDFQVSGGTRQGGGEKAGGGTDQRYSAIAHAGKVCGDFQE